MGNTANKASTDPCCNVSLDCPKGSFCDNTYTSRNCTGRGQCTKGYDPENPTTDWAKKMDESSKQYGSFHENPVMPDWAKKMQEDAKKADAGHAKWVEDVRRKLKGPTTNENRLFIF